MSSTRRHRRAPLALLLWAGWLLFGQTVALAHQHVDEAPGSVCTVCVAKAETAACPDAAEPVLPAAVLRPVDSSGCTQPPSPPPRYFQSRAPPGA